MPLNDLISVLALAPVEVPEPGDLPAAGRAWVLLAIFGLLMGLLVALLLVTVARRGLRRYSKGGGESGGGGAKEGDGRSGVNVPSHARSSPWSEAGRRAAPLRADEPPNPDTEQTR